MLRALVWSAICCVGCSSPQAPISSDLAHALALPVLALGGTSGLGFEGSAAGFSRTDAKTGHRWQLSSRGEVTVEKGGLKAVTVTPRASPCAGGAAVQRGDTVVFPGPSGDCAVVVAPRADGLKEDLVLTRALGDRLTFEWTLSLAPGLEARLDDDGSVAVLAAGQARYRFPAPVVRDASGRESFETARFELEGDTLRLVAQGLSALRYPLSIDPTLVVTLTPDFALGGNAETNISLAGDRLTRVKARGGVGPWTASGNLTLARRSFATVAYASFLYVIGGNTGVVSSDVYMAPLLPGGGVGAWVATTPLPGPRQHLSALAWNGYLYVIGGSDGVNFKNAVHRAEIAPDGSLGPFVLAGLLPGPRGRHTSVAWGNRLYVLGGTDGPTRFADVQVARFNGDGTLGAFTATTPLPLARADHASVVHDGRLYVLGGTDGTVRADVQFATVNEDGGLGPWSAAGTLSSARSNLTATVHGGFLQVTGGTDGVQRADAQVAPIEANGTLGPWSPAPSLNAARSSHGAVVSDGFLYVMGGELGTGLLPDLQRARLDAAPPVVGWPATTPIPARGSHATATSNGFAWVSGGDAPGAQSDVLYARVSTAGTVGAWTPTTALPGPRSGHAMVAVNGFLYTAGGFDGSVLQNTVHFAPIAPDGTIGAWVATSTFTTGRYEQNLVAANGYLYLVGGYNAGTLADVQFARINQNGTLGPFTLTTALPVSRYGAAAVVSGGFLYVAGGWSTTGSTFLDDVRFAALNADGTLGPFTSTSSFATPRQGHTAVVWDGSLYLVGGDANGTAYFSDVQSAPISASGGLGPFVALQPLPSARSSHTSFVHADHLFVLGGYDSTFLGEVLSARFTSNGGLDAFANAAPVPLPRYGHTTVSANGFLYVVGGWDTANLTDVRYAPISPGGTVGAWASTTPLPSGRSYQASFVNDRYLYVLGGTGDLVQFAEVLFAELNSNGTLGPWTATTPLPGVIDSHTAAVWNGHAYVLGGDYTNTVWEAPLALDGTVGAWTARTSFNDGRRRHSTVVYDGFIYVIGGLASGSRYLDTVQFAPLLPDGSIGAWAPTTSFANGRYCHASVAYGGYLYVLGGLNAETLADTQVAPINGDGTLGAWMGTEAMLTARYLHCVAVDNGHLYVTGGESGVGNLGEVEVTRLRSPAPRGVYSRLFDLGAAAASLDSITVNGLAPARGKLVLDYEVAPASGVFGARAARRPVTLGVPLPLGEVDARYLWVRLTLDDSESTVSPLDAPNERDVTDLHLVFTAAPDAGVDAGVPDAGVDAGMVDAGPPAPSITSPLAATATCGRPFSWVPTVDGAGPFSFAAGASPTGVSVEGATGEVSWTPTRDQRGAQQVELVVTGAGGAGVQRLEIDVLCAPKAYQVSCSSVAGPLTLLLVLLLAARRRG